LKGVRKGGGVTQGGRGGYRGRKWEGPTRITETGGEGGGPLKDKALRKEKKWERTEKKK